MKKTTPRGGYQYSKDRHGNLNSYWNSFIKAVIKMMLDLDQAINSARTKVLVLICDSISHSIGLNDRRQLHQAIGINLA